MSLDNLASILGIIVVIVGAMVAVGLWRLHVVQDRVDQDSEHFDRNVDTPIAEHFAELANLCADIKTRSDELDTNDNWSEEFFGYMKSVNRELNLISINLSDAQKLNISDRGWGWKDIVDRYKDDVAAYIDGAAQTKDPDEARLNINTALDLVDECRGNINNFILSFKRRQKERLNPFKRH